MLSSTCKVSGDMSFALSRPWPCLLC
ncbi:ubiquitin specific protease 40, isoform CRA_n [Rattus norvegicus]|uniref:Ubiquitin specific protease 40, isoform CRA_n n=1 Tax=Rattus norvegicus TaxID=10116 RepID=A6JQG8_RAT|nr:ubiquitin specific protease 40, isoform CRA_n [Rattus norvegicus]